MPTQAPERSRRSATWPAIVVCVLLLAAALQSRAPADAAPRPTAVGEFTLSAAEITIDGLRIEGTGPAPDDPGGRTTLRLSTVAAVARGLVVQAPAPQRQVTIACPANCLIAGRPARLYVLELTATPVVAGIPTVPITLTPTFPLPPPPVLGILQLPRLTFRDLRARVVLVTSDLVATPATRIALLPGR